MMATFNIDGKEILQLLLINYNSATGLQVTAGINEAWRLLVEGETGFPQGNMPASYCEEDTQDKVSRFSKSQQGKQDPILKRTKE